MSFSPVIEALSRFVDTCDKVAPFQDGSFSAVDALATGAVIEAFADLRMAVHEVFRWYIETPDQVGAAMLSLESVVDSLDDQLRQKGTIRLEHGARERLGDIQKAIDPGQPLDILFSSADPSRARPLSGPAATGKPPEPEIIPAADSTPREEPIDSPHMSSQTTSGRRGRRPGKDTLTERAFEILLRRQKDGDSLDIRLIAREAGIKDHRQLTRPGRFQRWYEQALKSGKSHQKALGREGLSRPHDQLGREAVTWDNTDDEESEGRFTEGGFCMPDKDDG
jgi:hypothetical protein